MNEIKKINAFGCKNIAVIVSKYSYDSTSLNRREQVCIYTEDKGVIDSKVKLVDVGIKPVFRLHPPRKGYEDIRLSFNEGGSLGYRGEEIKDLAKRML